MKTKVIAFRVTEEQYHALQLESVKTGKKITDVVLDAITPRLYGLQEQLHKETKRLEAKAKREAKKAAASGNA